MIPHLAASNKVLRTTFLSRIDGVILLGLVVLGIISSMLVSWQVLVLLNMLLMTVLVWTGMTPSGIWTAMRPWIPVAGVVLLVHVFTTTAAAPLGHPSWGGLAAGVLALARIAASLGWLALFARLKSMDDLVRAVRWWLRPLEKLGLPIGQLALVLAVALGTVPGVMNEGRRVDAVLRMRRAMPGESGVSRWRQLLDRMVVVVPLSESLLRRAEVLSLSLRTRQPAQGPILVGPPWHQLVFLGLWLILLILLIWPGVRA